MVTTPEGEVLLEDTRIALCRCGASKHRPFCDNSHHRIRFRDEGSIRENKLVAEDPVPESARLTITPNHNASLKIKGPVTIRVADGTEVSGHRVSLCRCGQSKNKPFCDGTHKEIGFLTEDPKVTMRQGEDSAVRNDPRDCDAAEAENA